ncbi:MAG: hypothetical protein ACHQWU_04735 [Gemmatimonadales bacterium]
MTLPTRASGWFIVLCWALFVAVWIAMAARTKRTKEEHELIVRGPY